MEGYTVYWVKNMPNNEWQVLREGAPPGGQIEKLEGKESVMPGAEVWESKDLWAIDHLTLGWGVCRGLCLREAEIMQFMMREPCESVIQEGTQRVAEMSHAKLWFQNRGEGLRALKSTSRLEQSADNWSPQ